jgi:hypothetical protein
MKSRESLADLRKHDIIAMKHAKKEGAQVDVKFRGYLGS